MSVNILWVLLETFTTTGYITRKLRLVLGFQTCLTFLNKMFCKLLNIGVYRMFCVVKINNIFGGSFG